MFTNRNGNIGLESVLVGRYTAGIVERESDHRITKYVGHLPRPLEPLTFNVNLIYITIFILISKYVLLFELPNNRMHIHPNF